MINFWPNDHRLRKDERQWLVKASVSKEDIKLVQNVDVMLFFFLDCEIRSN